MGGGGGGGGGGGTHWRRKHIIIIGHVAVTRESGHFRGNFSHALQITKLPP